MNARGIFFTGMLSLALLAGCATPGGQGPGAPIEERGPSAARAKRPAPVLPPKPQMPPSTARAPEPRAKAPRAAIPSRGSIADNTHRSTGRGPAPSPDASGAPPVSMPPLPPQPAEDSYNGPASAPVLALVDLAQQQINRGQTEAGAASLERALAIEPQNPHLWHRLARLRLEQGALGQAAELAAKSNLYAAALPALQVRNWRMIAQVRERQGDSQGARDAYRRAELAEELAR